MLRRRIRSKSPADTRSSETGIVPISYLDSVSVKSRPNSALSIGASPRIAALCGVDCAVIEANHDPELLRTGPYPVYLKRRIASDHGHLSNESAGALAVFLAEHGAQQLILGHLSRENNTPRAALDAVSQALTDAGFLPGEQLELYAAPADTPLVLAAGKACVCCR